MKCHIKTLPERTKLLLLSLVVGLLSGLAAVFLKSLVTFLAESLLSCGDTDEFSFISLFLPGVGMLLALLVVRYLVRDNIGHGVTRVLVAVSKNESRLKPHNTWSSLLASSLTIGFGGSVGAEAPIVLTGSAIGSNLARAAHLNYRDMTILLGCGAAGAVAGIFKAPLAGVLFTMEILLFNISMSSLLPLLMSSVSATVVAYILTGQSPQFSCNLTEFSMGNIPFYLILGIVGAFASLYFLRVTLWMEDRLGAVKRPYVKWAFCALGLGVLIFLFPQLFGEGYSSVTSLLQGGQVDATHSPMAFLMDWKWGMPVFFLLVFLLKVFAMTFTNAGGGVGGTFGPTLFSGALIGFVVSRMLNILLENRGIVIPEQNFVLVGMAALMAGVMQAPMTAIFLIAEISGGYGLLLPLIITATVSFGVTRIFERYSIYTKRIAHTGELLTHDSDQATLALMSIRSLIRDKYPRLKMDSTLGEVADEIAESTAQVFPVVDDKDRFQGLIDMDDIRRIMFRRDLYDNTHVYNIMSETPALLYEDEPVDSVMDKFDRTQAWRLPVVRRDMTYLGFISKSRILTAYRAELKSITMPD